MSNLPERSSKISPRLVTIFAAVAALTIGLLGSLVWQTWDTFRYLKTAQKNYFRLTELSGSIVHLDEVLTMSARIAAATGKQQWEARYRKFEAKLDAAIEEAMVLGRGLSKKNATDATNTANLRLVDMENQAFALVREGQTEKAAAILANAEYDLQKKSYITGITQITETIRDSMESDFTKYRHRLYWAISSILIVTPCLILGWILVVRLVRQHYTNRTEAEVALQESEERYRRIVETSIEGIWITNEEHRTTFVTKRMADMLGYAWEETQGRIVDSFMFEEDLEDFVSRVGARQRGESEVFERRFRRKDGTALWCIVSASPLFDGQGRFTGSIAMFNDITERKRAEEALRESEQAAKRLAQESELIAEIGRIVGSTLDIEEVYERFADKVKVLIPFDRIAINTVNMKDYTRTIRYVQGDRFAGNRIGEVVSLAGTGVEQAIRTKSSLLINSKSTADMRRKLLAAYKFGAESTLLIPLTLRDEVIGSLAVHSATIDAYSEKDLLLAERMASQIAGAIANAQLFRERKQAEEERQILSERLLRAEKMEALGQLAGGVAHDLNNVLGILTGYSELLLEEIPEDSQSRIYINKILQSTQKGATIIQDLLTLARRGVTASEVINLNGIVSDYLQNPVFEKIKDYHPHVTFKTEYDNDLLNIKGSPVHLEKTLMNLVSNAAEAISGEGEVRIRTESRYLEKPLHAYDEIKEGNYAVLTISDTGMGISVEDRKKIFEPFYTKKKMGRSGTGLGLAIVWGTIKDHNGYIDVQTDVGKGTIFTLYFPVTQEELIAQQEKIPLEQYRGRGESVLVVDDIADQREIASRLLTRLGYEVHAVSSGEEALEYLQSNKADILVLDMIMMPGIDGLETYKRILEISPRQKAIIVSGFSKTDRIGEAQKLGVGAYVKKPYVLEKIGMAIRDQLNRKHAAL